MDTKQRIYGRLFGNIDNTALSEKEPKEDLSQTKLSIYKRLFSKQTAEKFPPSEKTFRTLELAKQNAKARKTAPDKKAIKKALNERLQHNMKASNKMTLSTIDKVKNNNHVSTNDTREKHLVRFKGIKVE